MIEASRWTTGLAAVALLIGLLATRALPRNAGHQVSLKAVPETAPTPSARTGHRAPGVEPEGKDFPMTRR